MNTTITYYKSPIDLLAELGIEQPDEIDIEAIAQHCGATVTEEPLSGCEARIVGSGNQAIITVNSSSSVPRRRFSAGHELGHWLCDRGCISFGCTANSFVTEWSEHNPERRANRFAAELLLPKSMFEPAAQGKPIVVDTAKALAETFRSSLTATCIRLVECGSFPSLIVCTKEGQRKWFSRAPSVPRELWPNEVVGNSTLAYKLAQAQGITGPIEVDADEWISHKESSNYMIVEDSFRMENGFIISLLWWRDEAQLSDLLDEEESE